MEDVDKSENSSLEYEHIYGGDDDDLNLWNEELKEMNEYKGSFMGTYDLKAVWANEEIRKLDQIIYDKTQI